MDRKSGFDISSLRQQMEDLLEDFFPSGGARRPQPNRGQGGDQPQHVAVNLVESESSIVVTAPLPGLSPEDIDITVRGQTLTIKAQQRNAAAERPQYLRREWGYGPFIRTIELPGPVDADQSAASYRNGVVTLTLPKADPNQTRVIHLDEDQAPEPPSAEETGHTEVDVQPTEPVEAVPTETIPVESDDAAIEPPASFYMRPPRGRRGDRGARGRRAQTPAAEAQPGEDAAPLPEAPSDTPPATPEADAGE